MKLTPLVSEDCGHELEEHYSVLSSLVVLFLILPFFAIGFFYTTSDIRLYTRDLATLCTVLRGVAVKWLDIGLQLGMSIDDLDAIKANPLLLVEGVRGCLRTMLKEWLHSTPSAPNTQYPDLDALIDALRTPCVGESRLASNLKEEFLKLRGTDFVQWNTLLFHSTCGFMMLLVLLLYRWLSWGVASLPEGKSRGLCLAHLCA